MKTLYPPIEQIQQRLFSLADDLLLKLADDDNRIPAAVKKAALAQTGIQEQLKALKNSHAEPISVSTQPPPLFIQDLIKRRCATQQATFSQQPTAGQIKLIEQIKDPKQTLDWQLSSPLAVLLDKPTAASDDIWHGWMMSPDTDYAEYWDVLLEPCDEPFDPLAGMVQLWNPVYLWLPQASQVLGQISLTRLNAIRSVASEFLSTDALDEAAQPGFIAPRSTLHEFTVLTGTPLGDEHDPRHTYQHLYHSIAKAVKEPARLALVQLVPNLLTRCKQTLSEVLNTRGQPLFTFENPIAYAMSAEEQSDILKLSNYPLYLRLQAHPDDDDMLQIKFDYHATEGSLIVILEEEGISVETHELNANTPQCLLDIEAEKESHLIIQEGDNRIEVPLQQ